MQLRLLLLPILLLPLAFASCGGAATHESLAEEMDQTAGEMVDVLKGITDADSANAAKDKLNKLAKEMAEIVKQGEALGDPEPEAEKALQEKFMSPDSNAMKMVQEMMRVGQIEGTQEALKEFGQTMQQMQ